VMSPLIARRLGVHANLDGEFLINVSYCNRAREESELLEQRIIEEISADLDSIGIGKLGGNKRKNKQQWKQERQDKSNPVKSGASKGAE
jgi:hypothetical protein